MKTIVYVDDEVHNLTVFEAALPEEWDIHTYENPLTALDEIEKIDPCVVVADQRMGGMVGTKFLSLAKKMLPNVVCILVTGYSDEDLLIESIREAQVFDYIRKPWDADHLERSMERAFEFYEAKVQRESLMKELQLKEKDLTEKNSNLEKLTMELEIANNKNQELLSELKCWVPPLVFVTLQNKAQNKMQFPMNRSLVGIAYDIIDSSKIHGKVINGKPIRGYVLQSFNECVIRHGGWIESTSGDAAYGHFGLVGGIGDSFQSALAVAREFRTALQGLQKVYGFEIECGVAVHFLEDCLIDIHTAQINTPTGAVIQKRLETNSPDVDILHRLEKLVHRLRGTSIVVTESFLSNIDSSNQNIFKIGQVYVKGHSKPVGISMIPSMYLSDSELKKFREEIQNEYGGNESPDLRKAS